MYVHTLSYHRLISRKARKFEPYYFGSTFNRKKKLAAKGASVAPDSAQSNGRTQSKDTAISSDSASLDCANLSPTPSLGHQNDLADRERAGLLGGGVRIRTLSHRTKTKIRGKTAALFDAAKGTGFTFVTLTFVGECRDLEAVRTLNKFLTAARGVFGVFNYLWVAERQENGRIHFHLITDKRWEIRRFNELWVLQQYNAGIQHPAHSFEEIKERFASGTIQEILNPFDVKKITSIDGLGYYLTMYVTKNNSGYECAPWHCSRTVSRLFTSAVVSDRVIKKADCKAVNRSINKKTGQVFESRIIVTEHCIVRTIMNKKYFSKTFLNDLMEVNKTILSGLDYSCVREYGLTWWQVRQLSTNKKFFEVFGQDYKQRRK